LAIQGGDSGAAITPHKPDESALIDAVQWKTFEMPPAGKLPADEVAALIKWVELGAPWPDDEDTPIAQAQEGYDWERWRTKHWSFQPLEKPTPPSASTPTWARTDVDRFILKRLTAADLSPALPAEPIDLVRRIYQDLLGLPPSPEQVAAFVAAAKKNQPRAVLHLVEELLASPHYGERWARHWLDVARYSDGFGGFLDNAALPEAWRYRDWVVNALNRDMPFEDFLRVQIAGDLLEQGEHAVATGFFALGPTYKSDGGDPDSVAQAKAETLSDRLDTLGRGMLGLTLACARCHAHKFDPIPQEDYYSLAGVFGNTRTREYPLASGREVWAYRDRQQEIAAAEKRLKALQEAIKKAKREPSTAEQEQIKKWTADLKQLRDTAPKKYPVAHALGDSGSADMPLAIRGNPRNAGEIAPRRFLRILAGDERAPYQSGSGRLELAQSVVDPANPLTARVFVNRIWRHHFGKGLVHTPSNFGALGEAPTHPELLDWLAADFLENNGSLKSLHRTIINSATYQMSSQFNAKAFQVDGDNRLLWRMNPQRLDVEAWRDSLLATTGELDLQPAGPPTEDVHSRRRTLYLKVSRNGDRFATDEFLRIFDFPLMRATIAKRPTSITPQQYLFLLNSRFMADRAKALSKRLRSEADNDVARIDRAYRLLYGRAPSEHEKQIGLAFVSGDKPTESKPPEPTPKPDTPKAEPDLLIADFEGETYGEWVVEGKAFGPSPAAGTLPGQMPVRGYQGKRLVNSYFQGDSTTGRLTSPSIMIARSQINFLVGGGKYPGKTCINLLIGDKVVRTSTGPNDRGGGSEALAWATWDVSEFIGQQAVIEIVDQRKSGWGHINVDHIYQSNEPASKEPPKSPPGSAPGIDRWVQYAQVLLSANEFMYVE